MALYAYLADGGSRVLASTVVAVVMGLGALGMGRLLGHPVLGYPVAQDGSVDRGVDPTVTIVYSGAAATATVATGVGHWVYTWGDGVGCLGWYTLGLLLILARVGRLVSVGECARRDREERAAAPQGDPAQLVGQRWHSAVAGPPRKAEGQRPARAGGPLYRSTLNVKAVYDDGSWEGSVGLPADSDLTVDSVKAAAARIAKTYGTQPEHVHAFPYRAGGASKVGIVVNRTDPLEAPIPWRVPTLSRNGVVQVGVYANGDPAKIALWHGGDGAQHGLIAGKNRSGKSSPWSVLCVELMLSRKAVVVVCDPQDGASHLGLLGTRATDPGRVHHVARGVDEIRCTLQWVVAVVRARVSAGMVGKAPTRKRPALYVVVDELPMLAGDKEIIGMLSEIARTAAKVNVLLYGVVQQPVKSQLGGDDGLRSNLVSTILAFRIVDSGGASVLTNTALRGVNLASIPDRKGMGYIPGVADSTMLARAVYLDDESLTRYDQIDADRTADGYPRLQIEDDAIMRRAWDRHMPTVTQTEPRGGTAA